MKKLTFNLAFLFFVATFSLYGQKQVYLPAYIRNVNDVNGAQYSTDKTYQSTNFIIIWGNSVGTDPNNAANGNLRFDPVKIATDLEYIFGEFKKLGFADESAGTNLAKYKIPVMMYGTFGANGIQGFATGGQEDGVIGSFSCHPTAMQDGKVAAHELTHSLQSQCTIDSRNKNGFGNAWGYAPIFHETHANFMRDLIYPDVVTAWGMDVYHYEILGDWKNIYEGFVFLNAIMEADGINMVNRLWRESTTYEYPLQAYKRLSGLSQSQFNDKMYQYVRRMATYDFTYNGIGAQFRSKRAADLTNWYPTLQALNTILKQDPNDANHYTAPMEVAPEEYAYSMIPIYPDNSNCVVVKFKGHTEANIHTGWRYGFVAAKADGTISRYSDTYSADETEITFQLATGETKMYLMVMGAPKTNITTNNTNDTWKGYPKHFRFPYDLYITGGVPEGFQTTPATFRSQFKTNGHTHTNGGGWVANSATVASTAYVGPYAMVLGSSNISGTARITERAVVRNAIVGGSAQIKDNAFVIGGNISGSAIVQGQAYVEKCTISENAKVGMRARVSNYILSGTIEVGGDVVVYNTSGNCNNGVYYVMTNYYQDNLLQCDNRTATTAANADVNSALTAFTATQLKAKCTCGTYPGCLTTSNPLPSVNLTAPANGSSSCQGSVIILTATASDAGGSISKVEFFDGTTLLATSTISPYTYSWTMAGTGTHSITAKATDNLNGTATSAAISITVNPIPSVPTVSTPVTYCQNATAAALTATGTSLKWYTVPTNGTSSTTLTPSTATAGATSYYVSQTTNGCESARATIVVNVNAIPLAPGAGTPVTYCQNATAIALTATGTALKWYTVPTNGTSFTTLTPSTATAGTTSYYVSQTTNGCESARATIVVNVNAIPLAPGVDTPVTYCQNATATALTATGTALKWYTVPTNGTSSTMLTPSTAAVGTTSYYVSQTTNGCESVRSTIGVIVNSIPSASITAGGPTTFIQGGSVLLSANTGTGLTYRWLNGAVQVGTGSTYTASTGGNYTVEVTNASNCKATSSATVVTVNANQKPMVAIILPANNATFMEPASMMISATASDADGSISKVEFYNGSTLLGVDPTSPYSFAFNNRPAGTYILTAVATDNLGATTTSVAIHITVVSNQPSVISIISPVNNSTQAGPSVTIDVNVTDPDGSIMKVEYLDGNTVIGTSTTPPYSFIWSNPADGTHVITVRATDSNGGVTISSPTTVTVGTGTGIVSSSYGAFTHVYPNPSVEAFIIKASMGIKNLSVINICGIEVITLQDIPADQPIEIGNDLSDGTYVLLIKYISDKMEVAKLVKIK